MYHYIKVTDPNMQVYGNKIHMWVKSMLIIGPVTTIP